VWYSLFPGCGIASSRVSKEASALQNEEKRRPLPFRTRSLCPSERGASALQNEEPLPFGGRSLCPSERGEGEAERASFD